MRTWALAVTIGLGMMVGVAAADPWVDPAGRLQFEAPAGWRVQPRTAAEHTIVLAFNAANDCYLFGLPNPTTATATARAVHNSTTAVTPEAWASVASPLSDFFPDGAVQVVSSSVDTSGFWPVQRAELRGTSKTAFGAITLRPGFEIRALCSGASSADAYASIFASLGHPNDAAWRSQAEAQEAERAAAAAAAAAPPPQEENHNRRRNN